MTYYADSGFIVSCYLLDANTISANRWLQKAKGSLPFTDLHALEVLNAVRLGVFRRLISPRQADVAIAAVDDDIVAGRLVKAALDWSSVFRTAKRLSEDHSATGGCRSLDILHIAAAKSLRVTGSTSFDKRQCALAAAVGLKVQP